MEVKYLYAENYKTHVKEIEDDSKKRKEIPCSWINIVKMAVIPKATHRFNVNPIKLSMTLFYRTRTKNPKMYMEP